jgi:hypothetical protein
MVTIPADISDASDADVIRLRMYTEVVTLEFQPERNVIRPLLITHGIFGTTMDLHTAKRSDGLVEISGYSCDRFSYL